MYAAPGSRAAKGALSYLDVKLNRGEEALESAVPGRSVPAMTQDEPIMDGSLDASRDEKVAGIVEQIRAEMQLRPHEDGELLLRQRLEETGIELDDAEISRRAVEVRNGPSAVD